MVEMFFRLVWAVGCPAVIVEQKARAAATSFCVRAIASSGWGFRCLISDQSTNLNQGVTVCYAPAACNVGLYDFILIPSPTGHVVSP